LQEVGDIRISTDEAACVGGKVIQRWPIPIFFCK
jgi:hypothetical protein